jgi:hypothetical protein
MSWLELLLSSAGRAVAPIDDDTLALSGTLELVVRLVTAVCLLVVGIAMAFATTSTARVWRHR